MVTQECRPHYYLLFVLRCVASLKQSEGRPHHQELNSRAHQAMACTAETEQKSVSIPSQFVAPSPS